MDAVKTGWMWSKGCLGQKKGMDAVKKWDGCGQKNGMGAVKNGMDVVKISKMGRMWW